VARTPTDRPARADRLAPRRIAAERDRAMQRFVADRDVAALQATMARLDAREQEAAAERPLPTPTAAQVRRYLADLPRLWRTSGPEGRRAIAAAAFERIDAIGLDLVLHLTPEAEAFGWGQAFAGKRLVVKIDRGSGVAVEGTVKVAAREPVAMEAVA